MANPLKHHSTKDQTALERHYNSHKEDLRLQRRHGVVEFRVSMKYILDYLPKDKDKSEIKILDLGAGTGRYTKELLSMGYDVTAVEPVRHNLEILRKNIPDVKSYLGNALNLKFLEPQKFDAVISFGPMYHLISDDDKLQAFAETKNVTVDGGIIFQAYLLNDYSIVSHCFAENRITELIARGAIDDKFRVHPAPNDLYDYVDFETIDMLNTQTGLTRLTIFSPDGPTDFIRTQLNAMNDETFELFVKYQMQRAERPDMIGASSHIVDVLKKV
ncbi:MAG: class I SAM-dependent methyltransferase [Bacteroidales bacterium]|nr:class I SAM-dependent methyltransferase [Bacteroidales bacterium]